jgi:hypothetical protein
MSEQRIRALENAIRDVLNGHGRDFGLPPELRAKLHDVLYPTLKRALTDAELEQVRALGIRLGARKRRPVDVSDMGVPHVSEER